MQVSYKRDLNRNYMILENNEITGKEYSVRMMENTMPHLLRFQLRKMNGKTYLYYEITSKQPLSELYDTRLFKGKDIELLLTGIRDGLAEARQYLLNGEDILLNPEFIFLDLDRMNVQLCFVPKLGEQMNGGFPELAEYLLKRLDHSDPSAVNMGYEFYAKAMRENFSLTDTLRAVLTAGARSTLEDESSDDREVIERTDVPAAEEVARSEKEISLKPEKKSRSGKERETRKNWKKILLPAAGILLLILAYGLIVWLGKLDLTQAGGLAFLMMAVTWLIVKAVLEKHPKDYWGDEMDREEDDQEFYEALMSEVYERDPFFLNGSKEDPQEGAQRSVKRPVMTEEDHRGTDFARAGRRGARGRSCPDPNEQGALGGETILLTQQTDPGVGKLVCLEPGRYPDISLKEGKQLIGKMKGSVDVAIRCDAVSRIHAKIQCDGEEVILTDLNSMNGTFVNKEPLAPNEARKLKDGDKVGFASVHYRVKLL